MKVITRTIIHMLEHTVLGSIVLQVNNSNQIVMTHFERQNPKYVDVLNEWEAREFLQYLKDVLE